MSHVSVCVRLLARAPILKPSNVHHSQTPPSNPPTRRLKSEVERQMPSKHEHVLYCKLSKRQRLLYEEYMARSDTRATLSSGSFMGVISVLMQLRKVRAGGVGVGVGVGGVGKDEDFSGRGKTGGLHSRNAETLLQLQPTLTNSKLHYNHPPNLTKPSHTKPNRQVCNHPDLFEGRPIVSAYDMPRLPLRLPSLAATALPHKTPWERLAAIADGAGLPGLLVAGGDAAGTAAWEGEEVARLAEGVGPMMVRGVGGLGVFSWFGPTLLFKTCLS